MLWWLLEALGDNEGLLALFTTDSLQKMQRLAKCGRPLPGQRSQLWEKAAHCVTLQNSHHCSFSVKLSSLGTELGTFNFPCQLHLKSTPT